MKGAISLFLGAAILGSQLVSQANNSGYGIQDYYNALPYWGVSWAPGSQSINGYYQTFYTGFAMRSEIPERIHVRVSRGNQTRVSVILDEKTVSDYLFDLAKRYEFYNKATTKGPYNIAPKKSSFLPQLSFFNQIIESQQYGILPFVESAKKGEQSPEAIYSKALQVLSALNPGRVFFLQLDLRQEFANWKKEIQANAQGDANKILSSPTSVVAAINNLVFGRINYTAQPNADVLAKLKTAVTAAVNNEAEPAFTAAALELFKAVTGTKYSFKILAQDNKWYSAVQCSENSCTLTYPEFTAIYPTGSVMSSTSDEFGNRINAFATPGLWQFLSRSYHEVDNIRDEPFYGWAPKMDYEGAGNGFHNPAVRFYGINGNFKKAMGIPTNHNTLWAVKRGGVSHGCLRLPLGHVWEMRQIFPVTNEKATKIMFFGNNAQDFDLYDINGDGQREIMGVEYLISYGLSGTDGLARREGSNLEVNADKKLEFYKNLYGARNVFNVSVDGKFSFNDPKISMPSYLDLKKKKVSTRLKINGVYPLYEQAYERDKVQFYAVGGSMNPQNKKYVRLMGRVKGCAPTANKQECGEAAFDQEARGLGL